MAKALQKIKHDILNRFSGAVMFTAGIECAPDALPSIKIGLAVQAAIKAGANLARANLARAKDSERVIAATRILPEGSLIGWKKCMGGVLVKIRIPEDAKRSHAFGRKCRAEYVDVIEVIGADVGISVHDNKTEYRAGQRVTPDKFDGNWANECSSGIHFFITRIEAEVY